MPITLPPDINILCLIYSIRPRTIKWARSRTFTINSLAKNPSPCAFYRILPDLKNILIWTAIKHLDSTAMDIIYSLIYAGTIQALEYLDNSFGLECLLNNERIYATTIMKTLYGVKVVKRKKIIKGLNFEFLENPTREAWDYIVENIKPKFQLPIAHLVKNYWGIVEIIEQLESKTIPKTLDIINGVVRNHNPQAIQWAMSNISLSYIHDIIVNNFAVEYPVEYIQAIYEKYKTDPDRYDMYLVLTKVKITNTKLAEIFIDYMRTYAKPKYAQILLETHADCPYEPVPTYILEFLSNSTPETASKYMWDSNICKNPSPKILDYIKDIPYVKNEILAQNPGIFPKYSSKFLRHVEKFV